jgi:hypothetical protein
MKNIAIAQHHMWQILNINILMTCRFFKPCILMTKELKDMEQDHKPEQIQKAHCG